MKLMLKTILVCLVAAISAIWFSYITSPVKKTPEINFNDLSPITKTSPPCLQMYYAIEKYAEEYKIPLDYAYGIAFCETRYKGPFDWKYNHAQTSCAGAVGPMQIMPQYAHPYIEGPFTRKELMTNIDMNVKVSMQMLRKLKNAHGDWKLVFGAYNTGRPCVNDYAINVFNYKPKFKHSNEQFEI
jgi:hypothetical protein